MYIKKSACGYQTPIEGIDQKTLAYGEKALMAEFRLKKHAVLPRHRHPHEQTGYLVSGKIRLHIDDQCFECNPGDSWCIPGGAEHGADVLEDAVAIEVFSPLREDYLPEA
jgi:quercetin dioxygenase-like cupin family protein